RDPAAGRAAGRRPRRRAGGADPRAVAAGSARDHAADGVRADRRLRVDPLPDPHGAPPALALLPLDLAQPPAAPLQERALLARHHEHDQRPRAGDESRPGRDRALADGPRAALALAAVPD